MFSLSLSQKGILVVGATLLLQLLFVFVMTGLLKDTYEQMQRERQVTEIILQINKASELGDKLLVGLSQEISIPDDPNSKEFYSTYKQYIELLPKQMNLLTEMVRGTDQEKAVRDLSDTVADGVRSVEKYRQAYVSDYAQKDYMGLALKSLLLQKSRQIDELMRHYQASQAQQQQKEKAAINHVIFFLTFGIIANIAIAVALMVTFTRAIAGKVDKVRDNAIRLAAGMPLRPEGKQSDELDALDRTFHLMARNLQEGIHREQSLITNATDVILSADKNGVISTVNPACQQVLERKPQDMIGRRIIDIVHADDKESIRNNMREAVKSFHPVQFETRVLTNGGSTLDANWSMHWSPQEEAYFCVMHDITQRKQVERLKEEFVAMVSHDLRSPLASIRFILSFLAGGTYGALPPGAAEAVSSAASNVERLINLTDGLMSLEKLNSGEVELLIAKLNVEDVLEPSLQSVMGLASRKRIQLIVDQKLDLEFFADRDRLIQILVNLLSNAIKFSPEREEIHISVIETPRVLRFQIADRGPGVPAEMRAKIFERFKQVSRTDEVEKKGAGLGLSICKSLIECHGGKIGVEANGAQGSIFWFQIPLPTDDEDEE